MPTKLPEGLGGQEILDINHERNEFVVRSMFDMSGVEYDDTSLNMATSAWQLMIWLDDALDEFDDGLGKDELYKPFRDYLCGWSELDTPESLVGHPSLLAAAAYKSNVLEALKQDGKNRQAQKCLEVLDTLVATTITVDNVQDSQYPKALMQEGQLAALFIAMAVPGADDFSREVKSALMRIGGVANVLDGLVDIDKDSGEDKLAFDPTIGSKARLLADFILRLPFVMNGRALIHGMPIALTLMKHVARRGQPDNSVYEKDSIQ